jgi:endonuclease/exonuclease/phosphatase (EEP) superfamily protein YafD
MERLRESEPTAYDVVCGDFNTVAMTKLKREEKKLNILFAQYGLVDCASGIAWSHDIYFANFSRDGLLAKRVVKKMNWHRRSKLDYVWSNLQEANAERKEAVGSDHFPLKVTLVI